MKRIFWSAMAATVVLGTPVFAEENCSPKDMATRILQSANPNDLHADWTGESRIGTSWSLVGKAEIEDAVDDSLTYLEGTLIDPQGNEMGVIYGLKSEWICS